MMAEPQAKEEKKETYGRLIWGYVKTSDQQLQKGTLV